MITARESTGWTLSSKLVVRGPIFMATAHNNVELFKLPDLFFDPVHTFKL